MTSHVTRRNGAPSLLDQAYAILRKGERAKKDPEPQAEPVKKAAAKKKPAAKKTTAKKRGAK